MTFFEEFVEGASETLGSHRFTAEEIVRFARRYDPQVFHLDAEKAKASVLGGLCASGWHTTAVFMKLNVAARRRQIAEWIAAGNEAPEIGPSPGFENLRWPRPVYAGETITYTQSVTGRRLSATRPGCGLVSFSARAVNQDGREVLSFEGSVFCATD